MRRSRRIGGPTWTPCWRLPSLRRWTAPRTLPSSSASWMRAVAGEGHEWPGGPHMPRRVTAVLGRQSNAASANACLTTIRTAGTAQLVSNLDAIHRGQHQVEDQEIIRVVPCVQISLFAVIHHPYAEAGFLQTLSQKSSDIWIIFHDEDAHCVLRLEWGPWGASLSQRRKQGTGLAGSLGLEPS